MCWFAQMLSPETELYMLMMLQYPSVTEKQ